MYDKLLTIFKATEATAFVSNHVNIYSHLNNKINHKVSQNRLLTMFILLLSFMFNQNVM